MSQRQKRIIKWLTNTPSYVPKEEALAILKHYFEGMYDAGTGSHIVVRDPSLVKYNTIGFGPRGEFTVVIKGGQRVKGIYLQRLAEAVVLTNAEEFPEEFRDLVGG